MAQLSAREIAQYQSEGWVIPQSRLPEARVATIRAAVDDLIRADLTLNQRMAAGSFDESAAVDLELEAGQMSLHDVYMIHGAQANTSAKRRTGVALRYMPATSVFERDLRPVDGKSGVAVDFAR